MTIPMSPELEAQLAARKAAWKRDARPFKRYNCLNPACQYTIKAQDQPERCPLCGVDTRKGFKKEESQ